MFFEDLTKIPEIAEKTGCLVFVVPETAEIPIKNAIILKPETKATITIEQVREVINRLNTRQLASSFVLIRPADLMGEEAANAILKNLEETQENVHFVLVTERPSMLLPTILSRAAIYVWRGARVSLSEINANEEQKALARRILLAKSADLVDLAEELTKKKDGARSYALGILSTTIEMAYKSYFVTGKKAFLDKIPKLLLAYDNIAQNGHIKLHLVADLI